MSIKVKSNKKFITKSNFGEVNGYLIPIYNIYEGFFRSGEEPQQVYLTVINGKMVKGPHLHFIRTGCFTCIKGNARFILKTLDGYKVIYSGEDFEYKSVIVPTGIPAALQNLGESEAFILNMPQPAWTPEMNDEHTADFSDFDFSNFAIE
jgi:hypothetical protein